MGSILPATVVGLLEEYTSLVGVWRVDWRMRSFSGSGDCGGRPTRLKLADATPEFEKVLG